MQTHLKNILELGVREVAELVKLMPYKHGDLDLFPRNHIKLDMGL